MAIGALTLNLRSDRQSLGVERDVWSAALEAAKPDPVANIRHAPLSGNAQYRLHVAGIPDRVSCHYHKNGTEDYAVVAGQGTLYWGKADDAGNVAWEAPVNVRQGNSFVIPEGYAHQLRRTGNDELIILFGCPDSHLDNDLDRTMVQTMPPDIAVRTAQP